MSYKVEIIDEYSFGRWFPHHLRFATEAEADECSQHFDNAGWLGIRDLRIVPSDEPVNARWTDRGASDMNGQPISLQYRPTSSTGS
jgi:hypothetical protein